LRIVGKPDEDLARERKNPWTSGVFFNAKAFFEIWKNVRMDDRGLETLLEVQGKTSILPPSAAPALQFHDELQKLIELWPGIPKHVRVKILRLAGDFADC
jgi:hypothetical protein